MTVVVALTTALAGPLTVRGIGVLAGAGEGAPHHIGRYFHRRGEGAED